MSFATIKQGDTFRLSGSVSRQGQAVDITGWQIDSHIKFVNDKTYVLTATILDPTAGTFQISAPATDTETWRLGPCQCDVRFSNTTDGVRTTETFTMTIVEQITNI